jgi:hypothetical protein
MSPSDENDGFFDRLAKKLFASESSPLTSFADQQRAERLASCRQLETILNACQAESKGGKSNDADDTLSDDTGDVIRKKKMARFFQWDKPAVDQSSEGGEDTNKKESEEQYKIKSTYSQGCHRETHELWACRALALGCGGYLKDLRTVMNEARELAIQKEMSETGSEITYEDRKSSEDQAKEIQQMMVKCITKNATELSERMEARRKKQ